jgi:hypothetical protein
MIFKTINKNNMGGLFSLCFDYDSISDRERIPLVQNQMQAQELRELRNFITDDRKRLEDLEKIVSKTQKDISEYKKDGNNKDFDINNRVRYLENRFQTISNALGGKTLIDDHNTKSMIS